MNKVQKLYAVKDKNTGKFVTTLTNPNKKYWDRKEARDKAIEHPSGNSRVGFKGNKEDLTPIDYVLVEEDYLEDLKNTNNILTEERNSWIDKSYELQQIIGHLKKQLEEKEQEIKCIDKTYRYRFDFKDKMHQEIVISDEILKIITKQIYDKVKTYCERKIISIGNGIGYCEEEYNKDTGFNEALFMVIKFLEQTEKGENNDN